ncbi:hypothetical protein K504DRAFT_378391 [Pleomassaria siparia CBS 279.74]|uniref:Uncharacterized protein n=1 Tax=Pleomassaria siparia CBS 279.74 TaxID=1314801 RepID=A0A6G1K9S4_9PLEO|nr:hypothetical protein K504DRAFT_378391 [Pleomassaria siparia CBS 279.74]
MCCPTCNRRVQDMHARPSGPWLLDVSLVTLTFKCAFTASSPAWISLNTVLNNIIDNVNHTPHHTTFTTWSPCLSNRHKVAILTTASETCANSTSSVFAPVVGYLNTAPSVTHMFLDYAVLTLAPTTPDQKIACDIITVQAPNPGVAGAIGKRFGWDPKHSSLLKQLQVCAPAAFSRPGDLIRDFWAWAELRDVGDPRTPSRSNSLGSENEGVLFSTNSDEKNMAMFFPEDEEDHERRRAPNDDETLVMIFQWNCHEAGDRFKHPMRISYGQNSQEVGSDLYDRQVAHPVRQLEGVGAQVDTLKLELRGVGERILAPGKSGDGAARERSGSRTLGVMTGLGERVSGFWR